MRTCILCGSSDAALVKNESGYRAVKCSLCDLIYTDPKPSLLDLQMMYEKGHAASVEVDAQIKLRQKKLLVARRSLSQIQRFVKEGRLLEVGCGAGYFIMEAERQGFKSTGVEINGTLVEYAIETLGLDVRQGTLLTVDLQQKSFDVAYLRYVLSHMYDPIAEFERIHAILDDGGFLFFETGNLPQVKPRLIQKMNLGLPDHLYFFSRQNVLTLLERTGFELLGARAYSFTLHELVSRMVENKVRKAVSSGDRNFSQPQASWKERLVAWTSYFLTYKLGRVLPKRGQLCTVEYIAAKV
jgi:2-polyprenyl-3-methyl-5-hydroxy-6-metoxy-1,4-benzoquinol methylase